MSSLEETLKSKLPPEKRDKVQKPQKGHQTRPHSAILKGHLKDLTVEFPIQYSELTSAEIDRQMPIVYRDKETGHKVRFTATSRFFYTDMEVNGREVPRNKVLPFQIRRDQEIPVQPFKKTKVFEILKVLPKTDLSSFLQEGVYKIRSGSNEPLRELTARLLKSDEMAVTKWTFGGFKENYGLIFPVEIEKDKCALVMVKSRKKLQFDKDDLIDLNPPEEPKQEPNLNFAESGLPEI